MSSSKSDSTWLSQNPFFSAVGDVLGSFSRRRDALGLPNPGTIENLSREVTKDVQLTEQAFTGLGANITKSFSGSPLFQISHGFAMGSQLLPPYNLTAMFGDSQVCSEPLFLSGAGDGGG